MQESLNEVEKLATSGCYPASISTQRFMFLYLSMVGLHMGYIRLSFGEHLETLSTCPSSGLRTRSVALLRPFSGTICVFARVMVPLLLERMRILMPVRLVSGSAVLLRLCCCVSNMYALQNRKYMAKIIKSKIRLYNIYFQIYLDYVFLVMLGLFYEI